MRKFLFLLVPYCCKSNEDIIALHHLLYFIIEIILHFMNQSLQAITRRRKNICKPQKKLIEIYQTGLVNPTPSLRVRSYLNSIKEYLLSRLNNYKNVWLLGIFIKKFNRPEPNNSSFFRQFLNFSVQYFFCSL